MATNESSVPIYCDSEWDDFHTSYRNWHGYVALFVCVLGTIANTLNIIVLTRREMRSPTNAILTGLAVADLAVMIEYIPYTIHEYILVGQMRREERLTYSWAVFVHFHSIFGQVLHTISIWLTVTLAVWRYIAVSYPQKNRVWCGMRTTIITIILAYVVCFIVVTPSVYLVSDVALFQETINEQEIVLSNDPLSPYVLTYRAEVAALNVSTHGGGTPRTPLNVTPALNVTATTTSAMPTILASTATTIENVTNLTSIVVLHGNMMSTSTMPTTTTMASNYKRNITVHKVYFSDLALRNQALLNSTFLIYSVLIKLIPCIALTILSVRLIAALLEAKRRRKMLMGQPYGSAPATTNGAATTSQTTTTLGNGNRTGDSGRPRKNSKTLEKEKQTDRTTRMLLAVLLLFLITEFPQGILGLMNTILGQAFMNQCYLKLSDLMDILALINSSINFILYCSMSRQFRSTFTLLFRPKWLPVAQQEDGALRGFGGAICGTGAGGGKYRAESKSAMALEQQCLATQVTNV